MTKVYNDTSKLVKHLNGIKFDRGITFQESTSGRAEVVIPIEVRENPREDEMDLPAVSMAVPDENLRRDSLRQMQGIVSELAEKGLIKDTDAVQLRTVAGREAEEHMSWATINNAGADSLGPILGGRHVEAKLVIPLDTINEEMVTKYYLMNKHNNHVTKVLKAVEGLDGISVEDVLGALTKRRGAEKVAQGMLTALDSTPLKVAFIDNWNQEAELKKQGGQAAPLVIARESAQVQAAEQGVGASWAERSGGRGAGRVVGDS